MMVMMSAASSGALMGLATTTHAWTPMMRLPAIQMQKEDRTFERWKQSITRQGNKGGYGQARKGMPQERYASMGDQQGVRRQQGMPQQGYGPMTPRQRIEQQQHAAAGHAAAGHAAAGHAAAGHAGSRACGSRACGSRACGRQGMRQQGMRQQGMRQQGMRQQACGSRHAAAGHAAAGHAAAGHVAARQRPNAASARPCADGAEAVVRKVVAGGGEGGEEGRDGR